MNHGEVVAVQMAGDGVFVEFADGLASFFPADFLQLHRESAPNQLFVLGSDGSDEVGSVPLFTEREALPSRASFLLT